MSTTETLTGGLVIIGFLTFLVAFIAYRQRRTRVSVSAAQGTYYRQLTGDPYRGIRVEIENGSPHAVQPRSNGLQLLRLWPFPGWKTFILQNPVFLPASLSPYTGDEFDFEMDVTWVQLVKAQGWHRGRRLVRARVEVATIRPQYSPVIIASLK